jgi:propanol-preferring alcohol dehydrogenase
MKVVQLVEIGRDLELREVPTQKPRNDEAVIRIRAAGICHSDVHYREGVSSVDKLPITLGHEIAGEIEDIGEGVTEFSVGDRVCLNYMITCGKCKYCIQGTEQFCVEGKMIGKNIDGGYAEKISVPVRGIFKLPDSVSFEHAAVMMCSSSTSLHALRKTRFKSGESIAIFGLGGLGISALQLAKVLEASEIYVVEIDEKKLQIAKEIGAKPINAKEVDPVEKIMEYTNGLGVDVALELIGLPLTMDHGVRSLARFGRLGLVGITTDIFKINSYEAICREKEIIGVSDHLLSEIPYLLELAEQGKLDLTKVVTNAVPLEAEAINEIHKKLKNFKANFRTVIKP